jgi:hypothetical protein
VSNPLRKTLINGGKTRRAALKLAAAERMRRHRARRRAGFWSISVEIGEADVRGLIQLGFLDRLVRDDQGAVGAALHKFFDATIARG